MEDFYPLTYLNNSTKIKEPKKNKINTQSKKNIVSKKLKHSNSETDFMMKIVKEKRRIIRKYLRKQNKIITNNTKSKERFSAYKKGNNLKKIIRKNKLELSCCIENKENKNLKLFGNSRYNKKPPNLFVEDIKKKIPSEKMGLIPMPRSETDIYKEPEYIYTMQRNLSMSRRYQYNRKEELLKSQKDNYKNDNIYYDTVQLWWKKIPQIIKIQRIFKAYSIRTKIKPIFQLYKFMQYFEKFLINLKLRRTFTDILVYSIFKGRKKIEGIYISKESNIISKDITNNIVKIQNNFRCYQAKMKRNFLYRKKKGNVINKISFITKKIYVEQYKTNNNIAMIQDNIKEFIKQKNYVDKNLIHKNKGIYYFEKVYLNYNNQKIIKFVKIMTHILQLLAFKKKIYYKNPNDYDADDLNKLNFY